MTPGKLRVTFECEDLASLIAWAKAFLEEEGYCIARPHATETPAQFCHRLGIHVGTFCRRLRLPGCPSDFESYRGATGRVIWLRASPALEAFILEGKSLRNGTHA